MSTPVRVIVPGKNPNGTENSEYTVNVKPVNAAAKAAQFNANRAAAVAAVEAEGQPESANAIAALVRGEQPATQPVGGRRRNKRKATRRNKRKSIRRNKRKATRRNKRN